MTATGIQAGIERHNVMEVLERYRQAFTTDPSFRFDPLGDLHSKTISLVADSIGTDYDNNVCSFLINCSQPQPDDLTVEFLRLMAVLNDNQRQIARFYLGTFRRWRDGQVLSIDLMVKFSNDYLTATGSEKLPCTPVKDQKLFEYLHGAPHILDALTERVARIEDITPALLAELEATAPALSQGVL